MILFRYSQNRNSLILYHLTTECIMECSINVSDIKKKIYIKFIRLSLDWKSTLNELYITVTARSDSRSICLLHIYTYKIGR